MNDLQKNYKSEKLKRKTKEKKGRTPYN